MKKQAGQSGIVRTSAVGGVKSPVSPNKPGAQRLTISMKNNLRTQSAPAPKRVPGAASQSLRKTTQLQPQTTRTRVSPRVPVQQVSCCEKKNSTVNSRIESCFE